MNTIVVLISGGGTNLQALIDAQDSGRLDGEIVAVVSNKADAYGLERAANAQLETAVVPKLPGQKRSQYDRELREIVSEYSPDLVVLAGFMRLLTKEFLTHFNVINLHPALPGQFAGLNAIERCHEAWQLGKVDQAGVMVHWVPDEGVDDGPVIDTEQIELSGTTAQHTPDTQLRDMSLADFEAAIHRAEHTLIVRATNMALEQITQLEQ